MNENLRRAYDNLVTVKAYWDNRALACGRSFNAAKRSFDQMTAKQDKIHAQRQKLITDIVVGVACIGFGGALSCVYGAASFKTVAVSGMIGKLRDNGFKRAAAIIRLGRMNDTASFVAGETWDLVSKQANLALRKHFSTINAVSSAGNTVMGDGFDYFSKLQTYNNNAFIFLRKICEFARDEKMDDKSQDKIATRIQSSEYVALAPTLLNEGVMTERMKLLFYMTLVINSDRLEGQRTILSNDYVAKETYNLGPITKSAFSASYPKPEVGQSGNYTYPVYDRPGGNGGFLKGRNILMPEIERLYSELYTGQSGGARFERSGYGRDELKRAERALSLLRRQVFQDQGLIPAESS